MLVDVSLHSASAALHYQQGSWSVAADHVTQATHSLSVLGLASGHVTVEP
jgi:hypothetical protein